MTYIKNLLRVLSFFALVLLIFSIVSGQSNNKAKPDTLSPTALGEEKYQEMKAKGLLPQPEQVPPPAQLRPENIISPDAIERGKRLLIPLDETFAPLPGSGLSTGALIPRKLPQKPERSVIGPRFSRTHIEVKFLDNIDIVVGQRGYPVDRLQRALKSKATTNTLQAMTTSGGKWRRMPDAPKETIDRMRLTAQINLGREIANLNNYFILTVPPGVNTEQWLDQLNALPEVEIALPLPLPMPSPVPPSYQNLQGYLNSATDGIDANYAWTLPGGTGSNTTICDLEYSWNLNHQDLPTGIATWIPTGYTASEPGGNTCANNACINHGTAVLGEIVSLNNGWGTTGAANGANIAVAPVFLDNGSGPTYLLGTAMTNAMAHLSAGDVILIEQQLVGPNYTGVPPGTQRGLVPVEWWQSYYNTIVTAVGNGIHVVEAAGNGEEDLDDPVYSTGNNGHWPFLPQNNSGAIIVGAGAAPASFGGTDTDRSRLWFSNYGARVNLQGWGERVMTTGYSDHYSAEGMNLWYTNAFGGTSSASPIVASAVSLMESVNEAIRGGKLITPAIMREILVNTGSPQQSGTNPATEHIGPRPNLRAALPSVAPFTNGTPPQYRNDDGSTALIPLSFPFTFYSSQYNQVYINNNGNLSFEGPYWEYTPTGFPISDYAMVAAFWGDVDTRNGASGVVYYRSEPHRFTVIWDRVGYYNTIADKLNTFETIITDGTDPLIGIGNNVCFSYGDMQWTTGSASGGSNGFGGSPATVGINRGDGINYALKGRFDHEGLDYDGAGGNPDGISYLDDKTFYFNVAQGLGTISGTLFNDADGDCVRDPGEAGLPGWTIMLNPGGLATLTDVNGNYFFSFLTPNTYTISEILKPNWQQTCPAPPGTHVVVLNQGQTVTDRNFGNRALANVQDLSVSVGGGPARPGFQKFYGITYQNLGTITTSGTVTLSLPSQVSHLESSPGGIYDAVTHSVTWNVGSLAAGFIGWLWSKVQIPVNIPLGTTLTSTARINPTSGDVNPANNVSTERQTVRGSYDPNEKLATPQGDILRTDTLIYQINFQNVGTDTAFNIIVRDSLDDDLDIATMENGASSHPNVFLLVGRELSWTFTNIRLPDSNINEPGSHGFVTFKVMPRSDAADGAEILNRGIVYFDYNPPVITNTVFNRIAVPTILARVTCIPSTWYASWLPQPIGTVRFYIGGLTQGYSVNDIVPSSIRLNDVLSTYLGKYRVISSWPGFAGPVMEVAFNRYEALRTLGTLTPGQQYPVKITGKLNNGIGFSGETMITVQASLTKPIAEEAIPENFSLTQNYPNPFNPETDIEYALPVDCQVKLTIYNILGQKVTTLVDEYQTAGYKTIHWNGKDEQGNLVSSGIYFYKVQAGDYTATKKMVMTK